jgi:hypothetical protein
MITTAGKAVIVDFFGGQVGHIGDTIALGTGTTPPTLADTALAAPVVTLRVSAIAADTANNRIIFKAVLQPGYITTISEVGVYYNGNTESPQLVARTVLATPITVDATLPTEVEYSLGISV